MLREISEVEQRYDAVVAMIRDGLAVSETTEKVGVSRQSLYGWMARYEAGRLDAIVDRSHRPHHVPHQMPAVFPARVLEMRRRHPRWGPITLKNRPTRAGVHPPPPPHGDLPGAAAPRSHRRAGEAQGAHRNGRSPRNHYP